MVADGAVTKGMFGSVVNTFEENNFVLVLSLKVNGFEPPPYENSIIIETL